MKKIWPLLILVCSLQTGLQAQTLRYSSERKFDYNKYSQNIIGWMGDRLFVFQTNSDGATLNAYNDSMQLKAIVNLDFIQDKVYGAQFYAYPDRMIALYQENDYGKISQFATVLNTKGMIIKRPLSVGSEKSGLFSSKTTFFEYAVSPDRSKIMIIAPSVKGKTAKLICTMIDTSLKVLNKKTLTFKADDDVVVNNFVLGNDGSFYALAFTPIGKKGFAEQAWILSAAREERKFNSLEIDKNDNCTLFLNGVKMKLDPVNGKLLLGGFFSLKKNGNTDGTLVGSYMADSSSISPEYTVAKNFDNKARDAMGVKNKDQAFDDYKVRDILVKNDGSVILISENQIVTYFNDYPSGFMY